MIGRNHPSHRTQTGFTLVVTVSIMVLMALLAVGLLSLSSVSLRSSSLTTAQAEARANARMALILALGELQKQAGADMRITAPADILDSSNPPLLGVWRSWEGSNNQPSGNLKGRPVVPDYASKTKPSAQNGRFVSWLVSSPGSTLLPDDAATLVQSTPTANSAPLLAKGTLAKDDPRQVHLPTQTVSGDGSFAWWVSGENQKAHLPRPHDESDTSTGGWADRTRSHAVADPEPFNLEPILGNPSLAQRVVSRPTADFIADGDDDAVTPTESFHDLSTQSVGLLTNVATGGWRKDFSLLTENWTRQPASGLEFYKNSPSEHLAYTRPSNNTDYRPAKSMLYHWSDYRESNLREFWARRGPIASWARIQRYATLYKEMSATASRAPSINHRSWVDNGTPENALETFHNIRLLPQMARLQVIVSHYATTSGAEPGKYRPAVLYTPVITMWNPYNTRLVLNGSLKFSPAYTWPLALNHKLSGVSLTDEYWAVQHGGVSGDYRDKCLSKVPRRVWFADMVYTLNQNPLILEPGETRVFSPAEGYRKDESGTSRINVNLDPGVRTGVGFYFTMDRRLDPPENEQDTSFDIGKISLPGTTTVDVDAKFDVASRKYRGTPVCGSAYQWFITSFGSGRSHSWFQIFYDESQADELYPPLYGLASTTLSQCSTTPMPFLSMTLGSRIANHRATATKGVIQANPVGDFFSSNGEPRFVDEYPGNDNLLNTPWDFSVVEHPSGGGDMLPNVDNSTSSSYIVTGVRKAEGVSRIVAAELPIRPLTSLADLSQMQVRALNPTPPYAANIVGNSDASPLIPSNSVVNSRGNSRANSRTNEQQDDSYCANQVLFDDWFFSSIAPEADGFGNSRDKSLEDTYTEFLMGEDPLTNLSYRPIPQDQVTKQSEARRIYSEEAAPEDSWKTIASRLEVEGMFNVNSTSVKAWRALLGHARNQQIPYIETNGSFNLSEETDYAVSRTGVAGDRAAGQPPQVPGEYADTTEFTGYRVFTDEILDFLAEEIVEQVRLRGPFLSLSEFVNRQLSNDSDVALAGAIQAALNALTADSSLNPFEVMQNESVASVANPFAGVADSGYMFPEAAVGHNTYGLPGWSRQADILRPLAPILSARDDTFTIRAYGDALTPDGDVAARAWCEATVRRTREFCDPQDEADITTEPTVESNQTFGRRFKMISFRWLGVDEI